jgi:hypothetical protein
MNLCGLEYGSVSGFHEHGRLMHLMVTYKAGGGGTLFVFYI